MNETYIGKVLLRVSDSYAGLCNETRSDDIDTIEQESLEYVDTAYLAVCNFEHVINQSVCPDELSNGSFCMYIGVCDMPQLDMTNDIASMYSDSKTKHFHLLLKSVLHLYGIVDTNEDFVVDSFIYHIICCRANFCYVFETRSCLFKLFDTDRTLFFSKIHDCMGNYKFVRLMPSKDQSNVLCYGQCLDASYNKPSLYLSAPMLRWPYVNDYDYVSKCMVQKRIVLIETYQYERDTCYIRKDLVDVLQSIICRSISNNRRRALKTNINDDSKEKTRSIYFKPIFSSTAIDSVRPINLLPIHILRDDHVVDFYNNLSSIYGWCVNRSNVFAYIAYDFLKYDMKECYMPLCISLACEFTFSKRCNIVNVFVTLHSHVLFKTSMRPQLIVHFSATDVVFLLNNLSCNGSDDEEISIENFDYDFLFCPIPEVRDALIKMFLCSLPELITLYKRVARLSIRQGKVELKKYKPVISYNILSELSKRQCFGISLDLLIHIFDLIIANSGPKLTDYRTYTSETDVSDLYRASLSYRKVCYQNDISVDGVTFVLNLFTSELILPCGHVTFMFNPLLHQHRCVGLLMLQGTKYFMNCNTVPLAATFSKRSTNVNVPASCGVYTCSKCNNLYLDYLVSRICCYSV